MRNGKWKAATRKEIEEHKTSGRVRGGEWREPGANPTAIEQVYGTLADIWQANNELAARLASQCHEGNRLAGHEGGLRRVHAGAKPRW